MGQRLGAIEAGGTKFVLGVGNGPDELVARHEIPTRGPEETLALAAQWLAAHGPLDAVGIATFGPAELNPASPRWGRILATPKPGWAGTDVAGYFARAFRVPIGFDTDVNGAALAEAAARFGRGAGSLAYVTIGTGIGGGLVIDGAPVHGIAHPELGHIYPRRIAGDDFPGICPHHADCLEGLASGPAIAARWGKPLSQLRAEHPALQIIAGYLAQLCHTIFAASSVETVVLGGGVMKTAGLLEAVRAEAVRIDGGYLPGGERHRIEVPSLGDNSGIVGALMLADQALAAH